MKKIFIIVLICFVFSTVYAQMNNPLKDGMPNTVKHASGEVIYDLNGEWDAVWDTGGYGICHNMPVSRKNSVQPAIIGKRVRIIFLPQIL